MPQYSEDTPDLLPFLEHVLAGWLVCGRPARVSSGMAIAVVRVAGLYESRQAWLDREGVHGGLREMYEACWQQADGDLDADLEQMISESMKAKD